MAGDHADAALQNGHPEFSLALHMDDIRVNSKPAGDIGIILIGGPPRTGKTFLAKRVAERAGVQVVRMDVLCKPLRNMDPAERLKAKDSVLSELCESHRGLVVEGVDLITDESHALQERVQSHHVTASIIRRRMENNSVTGVIVGPSNHSPSARLRAIAQAAQEQDCWATRNLSKPQLDSLAEVISDLSRNIQADASRQGVPFIALDSDRFHGSLDEAVDIILGYAQSAATRGEANPLPG